MNTQRQHTATTILTPLRARRAKRRAAAFLAAVAVAGGMAGEARAQETGYEPDLYKCVLKWAFLPDGKGMPGVTVTQVDKWDTDDWYIPGPPVGAPAAVGLVGSRPGFARGCSVRVVLKADEWGLVHLVRTWPFMGSPRTECQFIRGQQVIDGFAAGTCRLDDSEDRPVVKISLRRP